MSAFEPSDWKTTQIPKLSQLDSLQRCLICKDFLKAPVITSCNHTFCSQCIRQHLMNENRCPLCKSEQFESNLKRVILLEEIVLCYQSLREDLISLVKARSDAPSKATVNEKGPAKSEANDSVEIIEITDDAGDQSSSSTPVSVQKLDKGYVPCPVCGVVMKEEHVQGTHLDYCLSGKPDPKITSKTPPVKKRANDVLSFFQGQKRQKPAAKNIDHENFYFQQGSKHHTNIQRLPKIDFGSLSTAKVKERLTAYKLPTHGSRAELEWRYNHYYLLHQSNLDSNRPLSELELRQKLKQWELSHSAGAATVASKTIYGNNLSRKSISDKDFPIRAWLDLYKEEFKQLVKQAKKSRKIKNISVETSEEASSYQKNARRNSVSKSAIEHAGPGKRELDKMHDNEENSPETIKSVANKEEEKSRPDAEFDFSNSTLFGVD